MSDQNPADLCAREGCSLTRDALLHQTCPDHDVNCWCHAFVARSAPAAPMDPNVEHAVSFDCEFRGPSTETPQPASGGQDPDHRGSAPV